MLKIGIFGAGVTGGALIDYFNKQKEFYGDNFIFSVKDPLKGLEENLHGIRAAFVCVPAHTKLDKQKNQYYQDVSILEDVLANMGECPIVFVRSTVLPKTCYNLSTKFNKRVFHIPEFLTERRANKDMDTLPIIAGVKEDNHVPTDIAAIFKIIFKGKKIFYCTKEEAEYCKYVHNSFAAVKVNFFNAVYDYCQDNGLSYKTVAQMVRKSNLISGEHMQVPGPDKKRGYGGKCLPKDIKLFHSIMANYTQIPIISDLENGQRRDLSVNGEGWD